MMRHLLATVVASVVLPGTAPASNIGASISRFRAG
jgi:hypothetical protein